VIGIVQHHLGIGFVVINANKIFGDKYGSQIRAIAPRNEPLETPVDVIKEEKVGYSGHRFTETKIKPIQTQVRQS
jgi:hypothetical protein